MRDKYGGRSGRDLGENFAIRIGQLEDTVRELKSGRRSFTDRVAREAIPDPQEGREIIQPDDETRWRFSNGEWRPYADSLNINLPFARVYGDFSDPGLYVLESDIDEEHVGGPRPVAETGHILTFGAANAQNYISDTDIFDHYLDEDDATAGLLFKEAGIYSVWCFVELEIDTAEYEAAVFLDAEGQMVYPPGPGGIHFLPNTVYEDHPAYDYYLLAGSNRAGLKSHILVTVDDPPTAVAIRAFQVSGSDKNVDMRDMCAVRLTGIPTS